MKKFSIKTLVLLLILACSLFLMKDTAFISNTG